jgi:hypothetical protein
MFVWPMVTVFITTLMASVIGLIWGGLQEKTDPVFWVLLGISIVIAIALRLPNFFLSKKLDIANTLLGQVSPQLTILIPLLVADGALQRALNAVEAGLAPGGEPLKEITGLKTIVDQLSQQLAAAIAALNTK